jgi:hypothetical protein
MKPYESRITQMTVTPKGEPIYAEAATQITINDEGNGEFLELKQCSDVPKDQESLWIAPEDWPVIRETIDKMIESLRKDP